MNKALNNILISSIFIVPISCIIPIKGTIVWYPQLLALMAIGFISIAMLIWNMNKFISLFLIYITLSYLIVCGQSPRSMLCLITGFSGILIAYLISNSKTKHIYTALLVMVILDSILFILQIFNIDPFFVSNTHDFIDRTVGFMGSRNQLGIFHASLIPIFMMFSPWLILLALPILLIKCSSAFTALCFGLNGILFFKRYKKSALFIFGLLLILCFLWVKFGDKSMEIKERIDLWKLTISQSISGNLIVDENKQIIKANSFTGYGIGNFFVYSPHSQENIIYGNGSHRYEHAHNDLIEGWFEFGYIGLVLIFLCISKVIADFITVLHLCHPNNSNLILTFCSLVTISICSMGVYVFHAPVSFFIFCVILGLFYKEVDNAKQSKIA